MTRKADLSVAGVSLALALWVTSGFWLNPQGRASLVNSGDQALFEWLLSFGSYSLTHAQNPLFTYILNVPDGVNLSVNTTVTVFAWLFAPLTMTLGAPVTFVVILTLNLAANGFTWYWLFHKHLGANALGAAIGGLFAGFCPAMISHANSHLNWTAQWLVPLIIMRVIVLHRGGGWLRNGIGLGLLITACFSIAAEQLFFCALALAIFSLLWVLLKRPPIANAVKGLSVAATVSAVFLAYPLWLHFAGPQGFHGTGFDPRVHNEDLAAYFSWPQRSLAGWLGLNTHLAPNPTEENSFFGIPLMLLTIAAFVMLWKRTEVKLLAVTAAVFTVLSLGPQLRVFGRLTDIWMPEALLTKLPIFNAALPSRLALVVAPIIGLMLAWLASSVKMNRPLWITAFVVALLPLFPQPVLTGPRPQVPEFFTSGQWESFVAPNDVIVPVPLPNDLLPDGQRWQAAALANDGPVFRVPSGFFLGPGGPDGTGRIGPVPRPTASLLEGVARTGVVPPIGEQQRQEARDDLRYWDAKLIVLDDVIHGAQWKAHQPAVLEAATQLFGPPERAGDVWIWRVS
ncbi:hypothetical protein [Catelliglobosispora koreensis]|uniref:hypothetical protein n=1 Tax=Catelliglobosispora koreensis TaxID=129052 RepID=UPI000477BCE3|nr:hypothetical protein [Catelliglobosispora koreensis]